MRSKLTSKQLATLRNLAGMILLNFGALSLLGSLELEALDLVAGLADAEPGGRERAVRLGLGAGDAPLPHPGMPARSGR